MIIITTEPFHMLREAMQIYWNKRKFLHKKKGLTSKGLVWITNMVATKTPIWHHVNTSILT